LQKNNKLKLLKNKKINKNQKKLQIKTNNFLFYLIINFN